MGIVVIIMASIVLVLSIAVVAVVLLKNARNASISGTIAGGAESFFGKEKARSLDEKLAKATPYMAVAIGVLVIALNFVYLFLRNA